MHNKENYVGSIHVIHIFYVFHILFGMNWVKSTVGWPILKRAAMGSQSESGGCVVSISITVHPRLLWENEHGMVSEWCQSTSWRNSEQVSKPL